MNIATICCHFLHHYYVQRVEVTHVYLRCSSSNYYKRMEETVLERQRNTSKIEHTQEEERVSKKREVQPYFTQTESSREIYSLD